MEKGSGGQLEGKGSSWSEQGTQEQFGFVDFFMKGLCALALASRSSGRSSSMAAAVWHCSGEGNGQTAWRA